MPRQRTWNEGRDFFGKDSPADAILELDRALDIDPLCAQAVNNRGTARHAQGDFAGALADFDAAVALTTGPERAQAHKNRGAARYELGRYAEACDDFAEFLKVFADDPSVHNVRGCALLRLGDLDAALASFAEAIRLDPDSAEAYLNRGTTHHLRDDLARAEADLGAALQLQPGMAQAFNRRSMVRHNQADFAAALADAAMAIQLAPGVAEFHHNRGAANLALRRLRAARADFEEALRLDPQLCIAHLGRGNTRHHQCQEDALLDHRAAFASNPRLAATTLAHIFRNDLRRDAEGVFSECAVHLARNPHDIPALTRRIGSLILEGRDAEAEPDIETFVRTDPADKVYLDLVIAEARALRRQL